MAFFGIYPLHFRKEMGEERGPAIRCAPGSEMHVLPAPVLRNHDIGAPPAFQRMRAAGDRHRQHHLAAGSRQNARPCQILSFRREGRACHEPRIFSRRSGERNHNFPSGFGLRRMRFQRIFPSKRPRSLSSDTRITTGVPTIWSSGTRPQ